MSISVTERTASAYAKSLGLSANPDLRDTLTEIFISGKATPEQLKAIPVLAGQLSAREQDAIEKTLGEQLASSPALRKFLADGQEAREAHVARWNAEGAANHRNTMVGLAVSGIATVVGIIAGIATGHPEIAWSAPLGGSFAATLAATYGFSHAQVIDEHIDHYGVYR